MGWWFWWFSSGVYVIMLGGGCGALRLFMIMMAGLNLGSDGS